MTVSSNEVPFLVVEDLTPPTRRGIELRIWSRADPTVLLDVIARRRGVSFLDEHNDDGGGSFEIRSDDPAVVDQPGLLDEGNLVEVTVHGRRVGWWEIARKKMKVVPEGEYAGEWTAVSGPGLLSWLAHAVVYPQGGMRLDASENRTFNFAGPAGPWLDLTSWKAPFVMSRTYAQKTLEVSFVALVPPEVAGEPAVVVAGLQANAPATTDDGQHTFYAWNSRGFAVYFGTREWWDGAGWHTSSGQVEATEFALVGHEESNPYRNLPTPLKDWPDASSRWVWDREARSVAPVGDVFFRYEFSTTTKIDARLYLTSDDYSKAYIDGEPVLAVEELYGFRRVFRADVVLPAGPHVLAIRGRNVRGAAAVNCVLMGVPAAEGKDYLIVKTGDAGWLCRGYPDPVPGWSAGWVMDTLLDEAVARGVRTVGFLGRDFDGAADSYNLPWPEAPDWSWSVGTKTRDVAEEFSETVCDAWVDPGMVLRMARNRGFDRSTQAAGVQPVMFTAGLNVLDAEVEGTAEIVNALLVRTADGWAEHNALGASAVRYGRREDFLSAGDASKTGTVPMVAESVFQQRAEPQHAPTLNLVDTDEHRPWQHFDVGDWVLAPGDTGGLVKRRIMSISVSEDDDTGRVRYACEIDTIRQEEQRRVERWLKNAAKGTLGGTVASSSGGTGGSSSSVGVMPSGPSGAPGGIGAKGDTGATGLQGNTGMKGDTGAQGAPGAIAPRSTTSVTTPSLALNGRWEGDAPLSISYRLLKIQTDAPARVQVYATAAFRTADAAREVGFDPAGNHGLIVDFVTTAAILTWALTPQVAGGSLEGVPSSNAAMVVTRLEGSGPVTVTLTWLRME